MYINEMNEQKETATIRKGGSPFLYIKEDEAASLLVMKTPHLFKSYSSGVLGGGMTVTDTFYNRYVDKKYRCDDPSIEYQTFLQENKYSYDEVVGLMTSVFLCDRAVYTYNDHGLTITAVITAGVGNAVDIVSGMRTPYDAAPGTINMFFYVDGNLTDSAFLHGIQAATEAKTKTLGDLSVLDAVSKTKATGTSTDSICIAASQTGKHCEYGGSLTALGQGIGKLVQVSLLDALQKYERRKEERRWM